MVEVAERKAFKSIHIDLEKGIFLINGEKLPMVSRIDLEFNNGKWSLLVTRDEIYVQKATKNEKKLRKQRFNLADCIQKGIHFITETIFHINNSGIP